MPGYKGHLAGGVGIYIVLAWIMVHYAPAYGSLVQALPWCLAGALFPDLDVKSRGQNIFYVAVFVLLVLLMLAQYFYYAALVGTAALLPLLVRHRGLFHRLWFIFFVALGGIGIFGMCVRVTPVAVGNMLFFIAGAVSHLWLDFGLRRMFR